MRIPVKGIHWNAGQAGGRHAEKLTGTPGRTGTTFRANWTPEFIASYNTASRKEHAAGASSYQLSQGYQKSEEFLGLAPRSRSDYIKQIKLIEKEFGDFPLSALPLVRPAASSRRGATASARIAPAGRLRMDGAGADLSGARIADASPPIPAHAGPALSRLPRRKGLDRRRRGRVPERAGASAPAAAARPVDRTAARRSVAPAWSAYDGTHIRLRQSKTGARVVIPVGAPLKAALDARQSAAPIILTIARASPGRRTASAPPGARRARAGIVGVTFNDLRGTAVTRLALVGCTEAEIATITGHSLRDVRSILDAIICTAIRRSPKAQSASSKGRTKTPN